MYYWTLNRAGFTADRQGERLPHAALTNHQCATAAALLDVLRGMGWKDSQFTNSSNQFARVEVTANGFNVVLFPSYAAAAAADQARAEAGCTKGGAL